MLVYDGTDYYTCPVKARNLSGRTGRGDTTFGSYLAKRMMGVSIRMRSAFATAAVSLKMETPGPLPGHRNSMSSTLSRTFTPDVHPEPLRPPAKYLLNIFPPSAVILVFPRQIR